MRVFGPVTLAKMRIAELLARMETQAYARVAVLDALSC